MELELHAPSLLISSCYLIPHSPTPPFLWNSLTSVPHWPSSPNRSSSLHLPHPPTLPPIPSLQVVIALGDYLDAQCHACIGGTSVRSDIAKLEMGQHIVVGTPGRVHDMIQRKALGGWTSV